MLSAYQGSRSGIPSSVSLRSFTRKRHSSSESFSRYSNSASPFSLAANCDQEMFGPGQVAFPRDSDSFDRYHYDIITIVNNHFLTRYPHQSASQSARQTGKIDSRVFRISPFPAMIFSSLWHYLYSHSHHHYDSNSHQHQHHQSHHTI
jgi:hypothetical protein